MSRFNDTPSTVAFRSLFGAWNNTNGEILPIEEVIKRANCDYEVEKKQLIKVTPQMIDAIKLGLPIEGLSVNDIITTHCATNKVEGNHTLGIVGADYGVVQNAKAFEFIDYLQDQSGSTPIIETAGSLGNGERIYVTCKLGKDTFIEGDDRIDNYVIFTTSHDGSGAVQIYLSPVRVVCQNTLFISMRKSSQKLTYKHTKNVGKRLDNISQVAADFVESVQHFNNDFVERMRHLASQKVDVNFINDFAVRMHIDDNKYKLYLENNRNLDSVDEISTRAKNQIEKLQQSIDFGIGQDMYRGSKLWLLNGVTTMLHNDTTYKSEEDEFTSIYKGSGQKKLEKAYNLL